MLGKGFKSSKCKTLLKMAMSRIKLLRNKRVIQVRQMRSDIAQLLGTGQEPSARIRVEHVIREQNILDAYDMVELYAELIVVRLPIIDGQKTCPADLKEAVSSLIFAAPRCADLPELAEIKSCFALKYGKEFVAAATELRSSCGVSRRLIEKMSVRAPTGEAKLKVLKHIAAEYNISWDTADAEAELLVQPEEPLSGPQKFVSASSMPLTETQPSKTHSARQQVTATSAAAVDADAQKAKQTLARRPEARSFQQQKPPVAAGCPVFKDVASAAQAAAFSAEQAAAAARAVEVLATREVLLGLSEQIMNADTGEDHPSDENYPIARHKLKDYLSGKVDAAGRIWPDHHYHENVKSPRSDNDEDLAARFEALRARRFSH